ncbi:hypothetical protein L1987_52905 [Smallanthus sonchifolius]|uniref:Uncharacterized protein n=1 Tax=Smallanthus sonchifolius TaxID=185202 RepID=A0ACB9EUR2_9ASTR|nr:hypothetical protein L1987_52905 [Smallanthus sonchifolius]
MDLRNQTHPPLPSPLPRRRPRRRVGTFKTLWPRSNCAWDTAAHAIPRSLVNFLGNPSYTFTGVGIANDVKKLMRDYNLAVARTADLRTLAADVYGERGFKNAGLQQLSSRVLGREISKPKSVKMSR